jgi:hypothetical protein
MAPGAFDTFGFHMSFHYEESEHVGRRTNAASIHATEEAALLKEFLAKS